MRRVAATLHLPVLGSTMQTAVWDVLAAQKSLNAWDHVLAHVLAMENAREDIVNVLADGLAKIVQRKPVFVPTNVLPMADAQARVVNVLTTGEARIVPYTSETETHPLRLEPKQVGRRVSLR